MSCTSFDFDVVLRVDQSKEKAVSLFIISLHLSFSRNHNGLKNPFVEYSLKSWNE